MSQPTEGGNSISWGGGKTWKVKKEKKVSLYEDMRKSNLCLMGEGPQLPKTVFLGGPILTDLPKDGEDERDLFGGSWEGNLSR